MKTIEECCIFQNQNQSILHECSSDLAKLYENSGKSSDCENILKTICLFGALNFSVDDLKELLILSNTDLDPNFLRTLSLFH